MSAAIWESALGVVDQGMGLWADAWYTEQERAEVDVALDAHDVQRERIAADRFISEQTTDQVRFGGIFEARQTQTVAMATLLGVTVVVGGAVMVWGGS